MLSPANRILQILLIDIVEMLLAKNLRPFNTGFVNRIDVTGATIVIAASQIKIRKLHNNTWKVASIPIAHPDLLNEIAKHLP